MAEKSEIEKRTVAKMLEGARIEQRKFDELKSALKSLKIQLEVIFDYFY